jgi:hypothetical protein
MTKPSCGCARFLKSAPKKYRTLEGEPALAAGALNRLSERVQG